MATAIVNIDVSDLSAGIRYYSAALGLKEGRRFGPTAVELTGGGVTIILLHAPTGTPPFQGSKTKRDYARHWTPVHLDFAVKDVRAAVKQAVAAGAKLEADVERYEFGELAVISDPFGHGMCLVQFDEEGLEGLSS